MHTVWNSDSNYVQYRQPRIVTIKGRFSFRRTKENEKKKLLDHIYLYILDLHKLQIKIRKNN